MSGFHSKAIHDSDKILTTFFSEMKHEVGASWDCPEGTLSDALGFMLITTFPEKGNQ